MNFYCYRHIRLDTNEVFYIGVGKKTKYYTEQTEYKRAYSTQKWKGNRSKMWHNLFEKLNGNILVEIILDNLTQEEAIKKEKEFIQLYGRKNLNQGTLVNLTDGGDGGFGLVVSEKRKQELREKWTGSGSPTFGKFGALHPKFGKENKGYRHTPEAKQKISERSKLNTGFNATFVKINKEKALEIQHKFNNETITRVKLASIYKVHPDTITRILKMKL